jgi:hypothetical protein
MRIQKILPLGRDLDYAALPSGEIRSIEIDNPSGQWLQLFPTYDYIAPYTVGFARTFQTTVQTITVKRNTPAGQVSTQAGDAIKIWLDSEPAPSDNDGVPFITEFTPVLGVSSVNSVSVSLGLSATLVTAIANRRFRLLTVSARAISTNWDTGIIGPGPVIVGDVGIDYLIADTVTPPTIVSLSGRIDRRNPSEHKTFPSGIDFPVSSPITLVATSDPWADGLLGLDITYQVI